MRRWQGSKGSIFPASSVSGSRKAGESLSVTAFPAGPGVASGAVVLSAERARSEGHTRKVILVSDIVTSDIEGIAACQGILTARGGRTSHAAVVARELGKTAIVGCEDLRLPEDGASCAIGGRQFRAGAEITLDGETGSIYDGIVAFKEEQPEAELAQVARWKQEGLVKEAPAEGR